MDLAAGIARRREAVCNCLRRMKEVKKENLPQKICGSCGRPFTWRKKWEKVWESVKYCSDACRKTKK